MNKQLNFEDNIFILNTIIRQISDIICLDVDLELFLKKTIDDMSFMDNALAILWKNLSDNRLLIDRDDELNKLSDLEWCFTRLLTSINGNSSMSKALNQAENREKLDYYIANSSQRRKSIENSIINNPQAENTPIVSSFELGQLLSRF
jgi:hypothetical protein